MRKDFVISSLKLRDLEHRARETGMVRSSSLRDREQGLTPPPMSGTLLRGRRPP